MSVEQVNPLVMNLCVNCGENDPTIALTLPCGHVACLPCCNEKWQYGKTATCFVKGCGELITEQDYTRFGNSRTDPLLARLTQFIKRQSSEQCTRIQIPDVPKGDGHVFTNDEKNLFTWRNITLTQETSVNVKTYYAFCTNNDASSLYIGFATYTNDGSGKIKFDRVGVVARYSGNAYWATPQSRCFKPGDIKEIYRLS